MPVACYQPSDESKEKVELDVISEFLLGKRKKSIF